MRTHQLLTLEHSRAVLKNKQPKQSNVYWSLFKKNGPNVYSRVSDAAYSDVNIAYTVYRERLIESCFELHVRRIEA